MKSERVRELLNSCEERRPAVRRRLEEFSRVPATEYFYELVYCLLTPQSSAAYASKAVEILKRRDFFNTDLNPAPLLHGRDFYIRFHRTKGRHLLAVKNQYFRILEHLRNGSSGPDVREWLVKNVKGIGYKEASHFLRNIGYRDLAILDRHILKNLVGLGVLRSRPRSLTKKRYLAIERKFQKFSAEVNIPMDELDLLFWSLETGVVLK